MQTLNGKPLQLENVSFHQVRSSSIKISRLKIGLQLDHHWHEVFVDVGVGENDPGLALEITYEFTSEHFNKIYSLLLILEDALSDVA